MMQINGETFFDRRDLRERYGYKSHASVRGCILSGKLPAHDVSFGQVYLWKVNNILKWEEQHGGNLNEFMKFIHTPTQKKFECEIPPFMFAAVPPVSENEDKNNGEFKPVSKVVSDLLGDSHMNFNDLAESNADQPVESEALQPEKITKCDDDSDVEFFALRERVNKLDGDIAELRQTVKELAGVIADLSTSLSNSAGLLYGRVKVANLKLKRFNDSSTGQDSKLEGTDE